MWVSCFREEWKRQKGVNFYDCTVGIWGGKNFMSDVLEGWGGGGNLLGLVWFKKIVTQFSSLNFHYPSIVTHHSKYPNFLPHLFGTYFQFLITQFFLLFMRPMPS